MRAASDVTAGDNPPIQKPAATTQSRRSPDATPPSIARRAAEWLIVAENPSGMVYGVIVMGALLAAESGRKETYTETFASAVIAACLYWVAHAYATVLGWRLSTQEPLTPRSLLQGLVRDWALVKGAAIPILALAAAWVTGASQQTAVDVALGSVIASLIVLELVAGILSRATRAELALEVGVGIALGLGVLVLQIVLR
jgi:hypothetical protein